MRLDEILLEPVISEKSLAKALQHQYVFKVNKHASKRQIAKAAKKIFGVDVLKTLVVSRAGENKVKGGKRLKVKKSKTKRATILVKPDQRIDLFETVKEES